MIGKLLVCAATLPELETFRLDHEHWLAGESAGHIIDRAGQFAVAVTGVGIPHTLVRLPAMLAAWKPDMVLNIGIAGAYPNSGMQIGDIAMARSETFGDIGFELPDDPGFRPIDESPFGHFYKKLPLTLTPEFHRSPANFHLHEMDGCTVNTCTGTDHTGLLRGRMFGAGMESMEGAAVALACAFARIPICEVRAISNRAGDRDMQPENIRLALDNLRAYLLACRKREGI